MGIHKYSIVICHYFLNKCFERPNWTYLFITRNQYSFQLYSHFCSISYFLSLTSEAHSDAWAPSSCSCSSSWRGWTMTDFNSLEDLVSSPLSDLARGLQRMKISGFIEHIWCNFGTNMSDEDFREESQFSEDSYNDNAPKIFQFIMLPKLLQQNVIDMTLNLQLKLQINCCWPQKQLFIFHPIWLIYKKESIHGNTT